MTYGVIDVGTNSVKFVIAERAENGSWTTVVDRAELTRLGEGLDDGGELRPEPIERTVEVVAAMADEAREAGVAEIAAVGTAGLRIASNSATFLDAVRERAGVEVEVISGEEESRLAYLAVTSALDLGDSTLVVFDSGGGSSQFTFGRADRVDERFSVNVGAVGFTERFGLDGVVDEQTLGAARDAIAADLDRLDGRPEPDIVVGMGGAVTNLAAVKHELATYDPSVIQGASARGGRGRPADRALPDTHRRRAARHRRTPAKARGGDPRRRPDRAHGARRARPGPAHRERPRPPPRRAGRAIRPVAMPSRRVGCSLAGVRGSAERGRHAFGRVAVAAGGVLSNRADADGSP